MKTTKYKSYDELPLTLNAETVTEVLGISVSGAYQLLHQKDFPALKIGSRIIVPKEQFILWMKQKSVGGAD